MNILSLLAVATTAAVAPGGIPSSPDTRPVTLQQKFDQASGLAIEGKCAEALPLLEALEKNPKVQPGSIPASMIAVRKGICLTSLDRSAEGEQAISAGLPALVQAGDQFAGDIAEGHITLGDIRYDSSDRDGAAAYYRQVLAGRTGAARLIPLARLARAVAFDGNEAALAIPREALAILSAQPKPDKTTLITYHVLYGRALLNQGKNDEGYKELKQALSLSGGLTSRTSLDEVSLRNDLAMAAMLTKRKDDARLYLAYTGAGRTKSSSGTPFAKAEEMESPLCGTETGLRPEDEATVEFGIQEDGTMLYARTIFSRGGPQVAAAFEQAVRQWYWRADNAAKIPAFYRMAVRVELRCSNRMGNGPGLWTPLDSRFTNWALGLVSASNPGKDIPALRRLASDETGATSNAARVAALGLLLSSQGNEPFTTADKALALARGAGTPTEVVNWLRIQRTAHLESNTRSQRATRRDAFLALAAEPSIASDPLALDTLLLVASRGDFRDPNMNERIARVARDTRLPENHPLRQLAWISLADRSAASGDLAKAKTEYEKTGLTEEQCALIGVPPEMRRTNVSGGDYPTSAAAMGFEGWVRLEYDINADGSTANVRPLVAYPPLIFADAATAIGKGVQYNMSYRPGQSSTACNANTNVVVFAL